MRQFFLFIFFFTAVSAFAQKYFEVESRFNCQCGTFTKKLSELRKYRIQEINAMFDSVANKSGMEFNYPQGGCQQRAEMMHIVLASLKIEHARIWLFAPVNLTEGSNTYLKVKDKNGLAPDSVITWGYHVAPCVLVNENNKTDTLIFDPSIFSGTPLTLKKWLSSIENSSFSEYTFLDSNYYFFNTQQNGASKVINGYFYTYDPVPGYTTMYDNATVERELAVNDVAIFLKKKLDAGYNDSGGEIKKILSNVNNLISLFAPQQRCNTVQGVTIRNLLLNHTGLLTEAFNMYNTRVAYWIQKVTKLK